MDARRMSKVTELPTHLRTRGVRQDAHGEVLAFPGRWAMAAGRRLYEGLCACAEGKADHAEVMARFRRDQADAKRLGAQWE